MPQRETRVRARTMSWFILPFMMHRTSGGPERLPGHPRSALAPSPPFPHVPSFAMGHCAFGQSTLQPRIERVTQPITQKVEAEHSDENEHPRVEREERCPDEVVLRFGQHVAPARRGRLYAKSEITDRRLCDQILRQQQCCG